MIKRLLISIILVLSAFYVYAQTSKMTYEQRQEKKKQEIREEINLDYSVPDYNVKKPDAKVMGWRLAKMLQFLEKNYKQAIYNRQLSRIRYEQMGEPKVLYLPIEKLRILDIEKQDSVITIKINTVSGKKKDKVDFDMVLTFVNSMSDDETTNKIFCDIGRYIREGDE